MFTVLFEDSAAILGLITAMLGIWLSQALGTPVLDGVASVIIGLILAGTAAFLAWECQSLLTGEAAAPDVRRVIRKIVSEDPVVAHLNNILTIHFGPRDVLAAPASNSNRIVQRRRSRLRSRGSNDRSS